METFYKIPKDAVIENARPVKVYEYTAEGTLVGFYRGYPNFSRGVYTLYPCYNPHVWQLKKNVRHEISDRLVMRET